MARAISSAPSVAGVVNGLLSLRQTRIHTLVVCLFYAFAPLVKALPAVRRAVGILEDEDTPKDPGDASFWALIGVAVALVLLGGVFAGLTIA